MAKTVDSELQSALEKLIQAYQWLDQAGHDSKSVLASLSVSRAISAVTRARDVLLRG